MTTHDTPNPILEAARRLQEQRMAAVQEVIATRSRIAEIDALRGEALREDAAAYQKALREGWTPEDLKAIGIGPSEQRGPGRPRGRRSAQPVRPAAVDVARDAFAGSQARRDVPASMEGHGEQVPA